MALPALGPLLATAAPAVVNFASNKLSGGNDRDRDDRALQTQQVAMMGQAQPAQVQPEMESHVGFEDDGGGFGGTLMATLGGAAAAGINSWRNSSDKDMGERVRGALGASFAGGVAGGAGKMSWDAVQAEGGGVRASVFGAIAGAAGSKVNPDGPGMLVSAGLGAGAGLVGNATHDGLTERGHGGIADVAAGAAMGTAGGYVVGGDGMSAGLGAGAGGLVGGVESWMNSVDVPVDMPGLNGMVAETPAPELAGGQVPTQPQTDQGYEMS